jgi:nanoRNase/pAp phosphatase (c-di-AMP/oligoRNAs hydrolase)
MEISLHKQIFDQYARAKKVLIVLPQSPDPDALASALELRIFLKININNIFILKSYLF